MKRIFVFVVVLFGSLWMTQISDAKINVVATTPDLASMAQAIGGDRVAVTCIGKAAEDPHYIQPKPGFILALNRADVLVVVGRELEIGWLPALLDQTRNGKIRVGASGYVDASVGIAPLDLPTEPVTRAIGDVHPLGNPHYLLDPERGKIAARNIAEGLKRAAPADAATFDGGLTKLLAAIDAALADAQRLLAPFRGAKIVTYHRSFSYFAERYGLEVIDTIEPKPGIPPSPAHVTAVCERMKQAGVKVIVQEQWHERRTSDLIAKRTGAQVVVLPVQTGGDPAATDYPATIRLLAEKLAAALR